MKFVSRWFAIAIVLCAVAAGAQGPGPGKHSTALVCNPGSASQTKFNFYRSTVSGANYVKLTSTPVTGCNFTDLTVTGGQTYFYVATGLDASSNESSFSNEVQAVIPNSPSAPGGVLVDVGATKATLTWNAVSGVASYNVYRVEGSAQPVLLGNVTGSTLTFTDSTIVAGHTYQWFVTSVLTGGTESVLSSPATVRPAPPTNLNVTIF
jgi:fibronectin type 3 domain-containing protein